MNTDDISEFSFDEEASFLAVIDKYYDSLIDLGVKDLDRGADFDEDEVCRNTIYTVEDIIKGLLDMGWRPPNNIGEIALLNEIFNLNKKGGL